MQHVRTVNIVLLIKAGLVSAQYHVQFDDFFKSSRWNVYLPRSEWRLKARLIKPPPRNNDQNAALHTHKKETIPSNPSHNREETETLRGEATYEMSNNMGNTTELMEAVTQDNKEEYTGVV